MAKKLIPFPANSKPAPSPGGGPAAKTSEHPPEGSAVMAALREKRDRVIAKRLNTQNLITKGDLVSKETVKLQLGRIFGAYRATVLEHSFSTVPSILAILRIHDSGADAHWRLFFDDEAYSTSGKISKVMEGWLRSQKVDDAE
jgi:hypothetical protein